MRKDGSFVKTERMKEIAKLISQAFPEGADYKKLVLGIEVHMGLTNAKAREYIDKVVESQGWINENGLIKAE